MARWLASLGLCYGLTVVGTGSYALSQDSSPRAGATKDTHTDKQTAISDQSRDGHQRSGRSHDDQDSDKDRNGGRPTDNRRGDGRRGGPPRHQREWWPTYGWRLVTESQRRNGGALELMPLLHVEEVRKDLALDDPAFEPKLVAYMSEMKLRLEAVGSQVKPKPDTDWAKLFEEPLAKENAHFQKFLNDELNESQQNRLIGLFVQARGYRSVSNQLVATKIGIDADDARRLRADIVEIRETIMRESGPLFRRAFEKGADHVKFEELVAQNHEKMDARIEKLLTSEQREKLAQLRGAEIAGPPKWLLRGVEMPKLSMPPRPKPPAAKSDCGNARINCRPQHARHAVKVACASWVSASTSSI